MDLHINSFTLLSFGLKEKTIFGPLTECDLYYVVFRYDSKRSGLMRVRQQTAIKGVQGLKTQYIAQDAHFDKTEPIVDNIIKSIKFIEKTQPTRENEGYRPGYRSKEHNHEVYRPGYWSDKWKEHTHD